MAGRSGRPERSSGNKVGAWELTASPKTLSGAWGTLASASRIAWQVARHQSWGPNVMQRILGLADSAEVSAKVQQDGFHGTGSDIDAEEQGFHVILRAAAPIGRQRAAR
jgi:hypothetical protein